MGLETATYISQLDPTFPLGGDDVNKGDDHIRLLKSILQSQFPNLTAAAINATVTELNKLDGLVSSTAELNILNGVTASTSDLNKTTGIAAGAEVNPAVISAAEAQAGNATIERIWTALRVREAIEGKTLHARLPASSGSGTVAGGSGFTYSWSGTLCTITHNFGTLNYTEMASNHIGVGISTLAGGRTTNSCDFLCDGTATTFHFSITID